MCEIGKSPVNQFEAQASVDGTVGPIKKVGNSSIESQKALNELAGNFNVKFKDINRCMVGKDGIAICATGLKGFFGLSQYTNWILNHGNWEQQKHLVFDKVINGKTYQMLSNAMYNNHGNITNKDILKILQKVDNDNDVAITLSALLSLATDNAKELQLSKLNATTKTLGMYMYGLSIGMDFKEIADAMMSPVGLMVSELLNGNIFSNNSGTFSLDNTFRYLDYPNSLIDEYKKKIRSPITNKVTNGFYDKFTKTLFKRTVNNVNMRFNSSENQDSLGISGFAKLKSSLGTKFAILEGIKQTYKNSDSYLKQKFNQMIFEFEKYCYQQELIKSYKSQYEILQQLATGAEEMRMLGSIFSLNQGIPTKPQEIINKVNDIQDFIKKRTKDFDLIQFVHDSNYAQQKIAEYDQKKDTFNILEAISTVPHFAGYLKSLVMAYTSNFAVSSRFRTTVNEAPKVIKEDNISGKKKKEAAYKGVGDWVADNLINNYLLDNNVSIIIPKGSTYFDKTGKEQTAENEDMPIYLGTNYGNATFKKWFETKVIPDLKKGILGNQKSSTVKTNQFIQRLQPVIFDKNVSFNASIDYSLDINMLPKIDSERNTFNVLKSEFNKLQSLNYKDSVNKDIPLVNLFYYYNLITYSNKLSSKTLTSIFEDLQSSRIIDNFHKYVGDYDKNKDVVITDKSITSLRPYVHSLENVYTATGKYIYARTLNSFKVEPHEKYDEKEEKRALKALEEQGIELPEDFDTGKRKTNYVPVSQDVDLNYFIKGETVNNSEGTLSVNSYTLDVKGSKVNQITTGNKTYKTDFDISVIMMHTLKGATINTSLLDIIVKKLENPC